MNPRVESNSTLSSKASFQLNGVHILASSTQVKRIFVLIEPWITVTVGEESVY